MMCARSCPNISGVLKEKPAMKRVAAYTVQTHNGLHSAVLWQTENNGVPTYFVDNEAFFNREDFYAIGDWNYPDNLERFVFFL